MEDQQQNAEEVDKTEIAAKSDDARPGYGEISAVALGRMLGLATANDIRILEGKIDLLASKMNQLIVKMEKILGTVNKVPTGADLERIDVQIGTLKAAMLDFVSKNGPLSDHPNAALQEAKRETADGAGGSGDEKAGPPSRKRVTLSSMNS